MKELNLEAEWDWGVGRGGTCICFEPENTMGRQLDRPDRRIYCVQLGPTEPMLEQVAAYAPAPTGFVAKCYCERPVPVFFQMHYRVRTKLERSCGVQK